MTKTPDLTTLDDDGLHAVLEDADEQIRAAYETKRAVKAERDRRAAEAAVAGLSDAQRQALGMPPAQVVSGVGGIESTAKVGKG